MRADFNFIYYHFTALHELPLLKAVSLWRDMADIPRLIGCDASGCARQVFAARTIIRAALSYLARYSLTRAWSMSKYIDDSVQTLPLVALKQASDGRVFPDYGDYGNRTDEPS